MFPTFIYFFENTDINSVSFLLSLKFLFIDGLELIILLYYKVPLSFIIGISLQLFFDIIFFSIFSIKKCFCQENKSDIVNLISSTSASEANSAHSTFQSNSNSENSQKDLQSDIPNGNEKTNQLQLDDCVLQPLNKIDDIIFPNLIKVRFDIRFDESNLNKNGQYEIRRKNDFRFDEMNDKPFHYLC